MRSESEGAVLENILSIKVAVFLVILVGLFISGESACAKLRVINSLVGGWLRCLRRSMLKSPV